jgi:hypothetical protein
MSGGIPQATITATGPMTRGDFLMMLYWFADTRAVPEVVGIRGLARATRLALLISEEIGARREIDPFFTFHRTPSGGVASEDLWTELLALRAYEVLREHRVDEPMPSEEIDERAFLLERFIPVHEREHYPMPRALERDVLTNKGTFFSAKREDQMIQRSIAAFKTVPALNELSLGELTARALPLVREPAARPRPAAV